MLRRDRHIHVIWVTAELQAKKKHIVSEDKTGQNRERTQSGTLVSLVSTSPFWQTTASTASIAPLQSLALEVFDSYGREPRQLQIALKAICCKFSKIVNNFLLFSHHFWSFISWNFWSEEAGVSTLICPLQLYYIGACASALGAC